MNLIQRLERKRSALLAEAARIGTAIEIIHEAAGIAPAERNGKPIARPNGNVGKVIAAFQKAGKRLTVADILTAGKLGLTKGGVNYILKAHPETFRRTKELDGNSIKWELK